MTIATINGYAEQLLDANRRITIRGINLEAAALVFDLEMRCFVQDELRWKTQIEKLGPNPASSLSAAICIDYHFVFCERERVVVISGFSKSVIISVDTGVVQAEVGLQFSVISSINFLHVQPIEPPRGGILIASEGSLICFDREINLLWKWEPTGPIAKCVTIGEYIVVHCLDFRDSGKPYGRTRIEIDSGNLVEFTLVSSLT